jgi:Tfp pilus assembly protein PilX
MVGIREQKLERRMTDARIDQQIACDEAEDVTHIT